MRRCASRSLWAASGGIATNHKVVHVNRNTPTAMRSPHEALGHFALESAMDELAYATGVDPVALRLLNDTETDPYSGRPFSTRAMRRCLTAGAARFGWDKRTPEPRSMRDGRYLIGQGMAGAIYTHWRWPAKARVTLNRDGSALVEAGTHDLGTGTYTVMQQVAADTLGLAPEKVTVRLGDTRLPASHASIGSATMANAGASVMLAARTARDRAFELALTGREAPFAGAAATEIVAVDGTAVVLAKTGRRITYAELLARNGLSTLVADGDYDPVEEANGPKAIFSFSAVFAEVRVDPDLGLVRLSRFVGAYDAGRIINPKTARSQAIGGHHLGRRTGPARAVGDRSGAGAFPPPQLFRLPRADECRYPRARRPLRRRVRRGSQPARRQGSRRADRRLGGACDRQCRVSRDRQASARTCRSRWKSFCEVNLPIAVAWGIRDSGLCR